MALTKENTINFLSELEGYHQALKLCHWNTTCKAEHLLTDDIDGDVLEFEDSVAENAMGILGDRISEGLKALIPNNKELKGMLEEMENDVIDFRNNFKNEDNCIGLVNCCDDFLQSINKWKYLETFE